MIELEEVAKVYQTRAASIWAVGKVSLSVAEGEFVSIVGPSGCGKSTLLNMIAGFLAPSSGTIEVAGQPVVGKVPPALGYIFQKDTLLPWYTVRKNVALGLRFQSCPESRVRSRVDELLELVRLPPSEFRDRYPRELSGGQHQRVGVARALALDPEILLMDEPFGALDPITRTHLQQEFKDLQRRVAKTIVIVTRRSGVT